MDMIDTTETTLDAAGVNDRPGTYLADAGYCYEDSLEQATDADVDVLIAIGRIRRGAQVPESPRGSSPKTPLAASAWPRACGRRRAGLTMPDERRSSSPPSPEEGPAARRILATAAPRWSARRVDTPLHSLCHKLRKLATATEAMATAT